MLRDTASLESSVGSEGGQEFPALVDADSPAGAPETLRTAILDEAPGLEASGLELGALAALQEKDRRYHWVLWFPRPAVGSAVGCT